MEKRIFVLGDGPNDLAAIGGCLKKYGYNRVQLIRSARVALRKIKSDSPALTIIHTHNSDGDGYDICKQIRMMNPDHMKIILLNGSAEMNNVQRAKEAGADDFVVKTSDYIFLMDTVRRLLRPE